MPVGDASMTLIPSLKCVVCYQHS